MKRLGILTVLAAIGVFAYFQYAPTESAVSITNAQAVPVGTDGTKFMVSLTMENAGAPVALTDVHSPLDANVQIMNPDGSANAMVLPGGAKGILAMDGAHIMMSNTGVDFSEGAFQSITLTFDDDSKVTTRVIHAGSSAGMDAMNHGNAHGVEALPAPTVEIVPPTAPSADGFTVQLSLDNIGLIAAPDNAAHVDGEGHAHIYLNGLKLGRLYKDSFEIGALKSGNYSLRIGLNTNDHRPYVVSGQPVEALLEFRIP